VEGNGFAEIVTILNGPAPSHFETASGRAPIHRDHSHTGELLEGAGRVAHHGLVRHIKRVVGWVGTVLFFGLLVALVFAEELLPELIADRIPAWIAWTVLGLLGAAFVALWSYVLLNPKHWRQWRQAWHDRRERRRRLANFELD
jgi:hypothetical protein